MYVIHINNYYTITDSIFDDTFLPSFFRLSTLRAIIDQINYEFCHSPVSVMKVQLFCKAGFKLFPQNESFFQSNY